jgi:hypothetical protein
MLFSPVNGQWRLFGLSLNVGQSGPSAPQPQAAAPAPQAPPAPNSPAVAKIAPPSAQAAPRVKQDSRKPATPTHKTEPAAPE